jgi:hypothetical protein
MTNVDQQRPDLQAQARHPTRPDTDTPPDPASARARGSLLDSSAPEIQGSHAIGCSKKYRG